MSHRNNSFHALIAAFPVVLLAGEAPAPTAAQPPVAQVDSLGEVLVEGHRKQQQQMRLELQRIEQRFYARYNELNTDDEFDIHCADEALTGTAFRNRTCQPRFVADISADVSGQMIERFKAYGDLRAPTPAGASIANRRIDMERKMLELFRAHPELLKDLDSYTALKKKYDDLVKSKSVFGRSIR